MDYDVKELTEIAKAQAEMIKAAEELAKVLEDGQKVEDWSFSAGTEERESGSARRQGQKLDKVQDWQERRISALAAFRQAQDRAALAEKGEER